MVVAGHEERTHLMHDVPAAHWRPHAAEEHSLQAGCWDEVELGRLQDDRDRQKTPDLAVVPVEAPLDTGPDCIPRWRVNIPATPSIG